MPLTPGYWSSPRLSGEFQGLGPNAAAFKQEAKILSLFMKVPVDNTSGRRSLKKAKRKKDRQCKQEKKRLKEVSLNPTMCPPTLPLLLDLPLYGSTRLSSSHKQSQPCR